MYWEKYRDNCIKNCLADIGQTFLKTTSPWGSCWFHTGFATQTAQSTLSYTTLWAVRRKNIGFLTNYKKRTTVFVYTPSSLQGGIKGYCWNGWNAPRGSAGCVSQVVEFEPCGRRTRCLLSYFAGKFRREFRKTFAWAQCRPDQQLLPTQSVLRHSMRPIWLTIKATFVPVRIQNYVYHPESHR